MGGDPPYIARVDPTARTLWSPPRLGRPSLFVSSPSSSPSLSAHPSAFHSGSRVIFICASIAFPGPPVIPSLPTVFSQHNQRRDAAIYPHPGPGQERCPCRKRSYMTTTEGFSTLRGRAGGSRVESPVRKAAATRTRRILRGRA